MEKKQFSLGNLLTFLGLVVTFFVGYADLRAQLGNIDGRLEEIGKRLDRVEGRIDTKFGAETNQAADGGITPDAAHWYTIWITSGHSGVNYPASNIPAPEPEPLVVDRSRQRMADRVSEFAEAIRRYQAVKAEQERVERFFRAQRERDLHTAPEPPRVPLHAPHARCCSPADAYRVRGPPLIA